jgi:MoaD family protein
MAHNVNITIPTALRAHADGNAKLELAGETIGVVLRDLAGRYPELGRRLFKDDGQLNRYVNIFVNDEDIRFLENLDTPLGAGDRVAIVPAIAGGSV